MEKVIGKIAALGVPGIVLLTAMSATGLGGAAAITAALAALGPFGMLGGIATLGVIGLASDAVAKYGYTAIFSAVVKELYKKGETIESIQEKILKYPISKSVKVKLMADLEKLANKEATAITENSEEKNSEGEE